MIKLMRQHHFRPRKRWGQNFLIDRNIRDRIIETASLRKTDTVIEIGPGFGALTERLSHKVKRVIAVERDEKLCSILRRHIISCSNVEVVSGDILKLDFTKLLHNAKVVGNLPYYITSPIIVHLLKSRALIDSIIITIQKEVAQRLLSEAGRSSYGAISCFVQFYSKPSLIMEIKKNAFFPQPEVNSSLVKLKILKVPEVRVKDEKLFFRIIRASFNQRRKTLLNSLSSKLKLDPSLKRSGKVYLCPLGHPLGLNKQSLLKILESAKINPHRRGETLSLEEFAKIANHIISYEL